MKHAGSKALTPWETSSAECNWGLHVKQGRAIAAGCHNMGASKPQPGAGAETQVVTLAEQPGRGSAPGPPAALSLHSRATCTTWPHLV